MARIGLDIDGTVGNYTKLLHGVAQNHGIIQRGKYFDPKTYNMVEDGWFKNNDDFLKAHRILCSENNGIARMELLEPAINNAVIEWKKMGHEVVVVTARLMRDHDDKLRSKVIKDTHDWINRFIPDVDDIAIVQGGEKESIEADLYIDDSPHEISNLSNSGMNVLIRHQDYNKEILGDRVFTLHNVYKTLTAM